VLPPDIILGK